MANTLILCDCSGSIDYDAAELSKACGLACSRVHTALCTTELADAAALIKQGDAVIACVQEQQVFEELAEEVGVPAPEFVDLRDRAGWSEDSKNSTPKMVALINDRGANSTSVKMLEIESFGQCLVLGASGPALEAAEQLSGILEVTVLLDSLESATPNAGYDVVLGRLKSAKGSLGDFDIRIDALQLAQPGGRGDLGFLPPKDGAISTCDILLDLRGDMPLFHHKRDGYLRPDPKSKTAVAKAILEASQLVGIFEKPLYVAVENSICAHSRAEITGCTRCIDVCSTGAITGDGDHVKIDASICAGCGGCASVCPSGAISFALPAFATMTQRLERLAAAYSKSGGAVPRLLVHDAEFGAEMISMAARFDRGLPSDVIPFEIESLANFGHAPILAALGCGFGSVDVLLSPKTERQPIEDAIELAKAISKNSTIELLDINDPTAFCAALYGRPDLQSISPILPIGNQRQVTRLAAKVLNTAHQTPLPLPQGAPYGAVLVDQASCTLCLSCVSLCPSGALMDNPDSPQLRFQEDACLQCGICANACPENAITLIPQLDLSDAALSQTILHEEEPFACVSCGGLFGVKSSIERVMEKLAGKHPMFADSEQSKLIQMCDNCRVEAQYHSDSSPFKSAPRPKVRTTDDYLKRRDH